MEEKHFIIACIDKSSSIRLNTFTQSRYIVNIQNCGREQR